MSHYIPSPHLCYILMSTVTRKIYVGYTIDFPHRLRQHNGEIKGGAKRTSKGRPWILICLIRGFPESSVALRFEYRLQCLCRKKWTLPDTLNNLNWLINNGDGSKVKNNKMPWPFLILFWHYKLKG